MKHYIYIFFLFSFFITSNLEAQQISPPNSVRGILRLDSLITTSQISQDSTTNNFQTHTSKLLVVVNLATISNLDKIHVKVGSTSGANDIAQYTFQFDINQNLPIDYSYYRKGLRLELYMGKYSNLNSFNIEVKLEDVNGNLSTPVYYSKN